MESKTGSRLLAFETGSKLFEGLVEAGLHGADRSAQDGRHLVELEAVEDPQQYNFAVLGCQMRNQSSEGKLHLWRAGTSLTKCSTEAVEFDRVFDRQRRTPNMGPMKIDGNTKQP